jgi:outer membrane protein TolC
VAVDQALTGSLPPNAWSGARLSASLGALDAPAWIDAAQQSALARAARWAAEGTVLDVQYAAAVLFYSAIAAEEGQAAARRTLDFAEATARATRVRVAAGLDSQVIGQAAELALLEARAQQARADGEVVKARARLERALQQPYDRLEPTPLETPPAGGNADSGDSPYVHAARASGAAAHLACDEAWAELLPTATINAWAPLSEDGTARITDGDAWTLGVSARWQLDGIAGPVLRARSAQLGAQATDILVDALERDLALAERVAAADARAAQEVAAAARASEELADAALRTGQARLDAGLASALEVLRLQDDAARARSARVQAELAAVTARLEARRVAGVRWSGAADPSAGRSSPG